MRKWGEKLVLLWLRRPLLTIAKEVSCLFFSSFFVRFLTIDPNFKILLSYWSTFKLFFLRTDMRRKESFKQGTSLILCTTFFFSFFCMNHFKAESKKALAAPFCCLHTISFAISRKSAQLCVFLSCDSYNDGHSISKHNNDCRRIPWCDIFHLGWLGSVKTSVS